MKHFPALTLACLLAMAGPALAQNDNAHDAHHPAASVLAAAADTTEAEVRKVDLVAQKITLRHGAIKNLDMPGMTMVFQVKDPALLAQVKAGDKVRFTADKINGAYTVLTLEPVGK